MRRALTAALCAAALAFAANVARAHEFWLSPLAYRVDPGAPLQADIRVGQKFGGTAFAYLPPDIARFDIVMGDAVIAVTGRPGDRPALNMPVPGEGLAVVVHVTRDMRLTYSEAQKFIDFVTHKDLTGVLQAHEARGLPPQGFVERYTRYAKSLIAVGAGAGADRAVGLETEIVALANPYTDDTSAGLPVQVLYQGAPRADVQVELFERAPDGTVSISQLRTDATGQALLPVRPGHEYLVDSVVMRPLDPPGDEGAVWHSLWASLTLQIPG
ncbi:MAG: DUF4198 domain-containing protein [Roseivivax sp.]|nr:DUF4198 domain-containing protein [Roseivivax sp.]